MYLHDLLTKSKISLPSKINLIEITAPLTSKNMLELVDWAQKDCKWTRARISAINAKKGLSGSEGGKLFTVKNDKLFKIKGGEEFLYCPSNCVMQCLEILHLPHHLGAHKLDKYGSATHNI